MVFMDWRNDLEGLYAGYMEEYMENTQLNM